MTDSTTELLPEQEAYSDGIDAAKDVIRGEVFKDSDTADYIIPCLINAIARKTNPYSYRAQHVQSPSEHCWHCGVVVVPERVRCEDCPSECDLEDCDEMGCRQ